MKSYSKSIAIIAAAITILGAQSLYACAGCGCAAKKAEKAKKPAACCVAAKKAGTECKACALKKAPEAKKSSQCSGGVCPLKK